jgi:alpha-tubulin suppressor-like RCC1 family protein
MRRTLVALVFAGLCGTLLLLSNSSVEAQRLQRLSAPSAPLVTPQISAGYYHTCVLVQNGGVKCWGRNAEGQLGYGDTTHRGDNAGEMGASLPYVALGTGRTAVSLISGGYHNCAILDNGSVKCWGYNAYGALGLGDTNGRGDAANEMGDNLPAISLGTGRSAVQLSAGYQHTCARLDNGSVKCWGYNAAGQLGPA